MKNIDIATMKKTLPSIRKGVEKYIDIMAWVHSCNVSQAADFQKVFNGYYRIRQRPSDFYQAYYAYMESKKSDSVTFEDILSHLHKLTSRHEPSFASKLLATIDPDKPVWDVNVLSNLSIKPPRYYAKNRLEEIVKTYDVLENWFDDYLKTQNALDVICLFDEIYPTVNITNVKKIDFALWSLGEKK